MTSGLPEKTPPAPVPARNRTRLLALTGIVVFSAALVMAYREITRATAPTRFAFNIYPQPRALPDVRFAEGKGRAVTLQDFRGKLVLLNVWATWCPPCRREMPALDRLQQRLGGPDFKVVALSIDQGQQSLYFVQEFYLQTGIKFLEVYMDTSSNASQDLAVAGLPTTLLIDREGREIGRKIGPAEWDSPEIVALIRGYLALPASNQPVKQ